MKCDECGGTYRIFSDRFEYLDPIVGTISVQGVPYYKCDKNGDLLFTAEMSQALDEARKTRIDELLKKFPIQDFISAKDTSDLLGITRQGLHKNRRIQNGFIYHTCFGDKTVYLKQSALRYKETGDGRFPLNVKGFTPDTRFTTCLPAKL
jgi:hypothetical protein